jgi:bifunctional UDP-N-acetylglucosamine pyrophosphorylase/glucosamine-1-phosphate N-acetyltransferase
VTEERTVVVLAAGEGKRMNSAMPKVMHPLLGRSMLGHVLQALSALAPGRSVVVVGHGADELTEHLAQIAPAARAVLQEEQNGTGHATRVAVEAAGIASGTVIVAFGDTPLLRADTLVGLVQTHEAAGAAATILTAQLADPYGLGRILRNANGDVDAIVEERDATPAQREITEINAGVYAFDAALLAPALGKLTTQNAQGEEYLTDVIGLLVDSGRTVLGYPTAEWADVLGCNDRVQLATVRATLRDRVNTAWQLAGATIVDPATTWIDVTVRLERDCVIEPNTHLRGQTSIGVGAVVGPDTTLIDTTVGERASVVRAHAVSSVIGAGASVGPYAYLRPGSVLRERSKVGTFVETKNADIGAGTKIPHLSYVGDATIGEQTNIGAATVFVNYDGQTKRHTVIGSHARTGADNMFVAPVVVGDGAYTAAGSVIDSDVPPGALGVARARQRNINGWVLRKRAGSAAARAAQAAAGAVEPPVQPAVDGSTKTPDATEITRAEPPAAGDSSRGDTAIG